MPRRGVARPNKLSMALALATPKRLTTVKSCPSLKVWTFLRSG